MTFSSQRTSREPSEVAWRSSLSSRWHKVLMSGALPLPCHLQWIRIRQPNPRERPAYCERSIFSRLPHFKERRRNGFRRVTR